MYGLGCLEVCMASITKGKHEKNTFLLSDGIIT